MVFEFSWQIGAGKNSHIPVKWSTIHPPSDDTIFVSWNDGSRFSNCVYQLYLNQSPELSKMTGGQRLGIMENMNFLFIAVNVDVLVRQPLPRLTNSKWVLHSGKIMASAASVMQNMQCAGEGCVRPRACLEVAWKPCNGGSYTGLDFLEQAKSR